MRNLKLLDQYRIEHPTNGWGDEKEGAFMIPGPNKVLMAIASTGDGWDHVSVSTLNRCPNWPEMKKIKEMFFHDEESTYQYYPKKEDYISFHPYCLHWWRPQNIEIPHPPKYMIA